MTTKEQLQAIATKALSDESYAEQLRADLTGTLEAEGITLSDEDKAGLQQTLEDAYRPAGRESKFRAK